MLRCNSLWSSAPRFIRHQLPSSTPTESTEVHWWASRCHICPQDQSPESVSKKGWWANHQSTQWLKGSGDYSETDQAEQTGPDWGRIFCLCPDRQSPQISTKKFNEEEKQKTKQQTNKKPKEPHEAQWKCHFWLHHQHCPTDVALIFRERTPWTHGRDPGDSPVCKPQCRWPPPLQRHRQRQTVRWNAQLIESCKGKYF